MEGICIHCGKSFKTNPRVKNQRYCKNENCQKARRARWQRDKMAKDPDYKENQRSCWKGWIRAHPGYYKEYRAGNLEYVKRNRFLQLRRNARMRKNKLSMLIAKMDSLNNPFYSRRGSLFRLVPEGDNLIAKMDSLIVKLIPCKELRSHGQAYT